MFEEYGTVMDVDETCEALRIGRNSLYGLLNNGELKGYKIGRVWKIPKESIIRFVLNKSGLKP